jgi:hypothetical protein
VYKLEKIQRQSEDSLEQQCFREIVLRLREGENNLDDWRQLTTRFEENLNRIEQEWFSDAMFILTKWIDVDKINVMMLRDLNRPVAKIIVVHTGGQNAKCANSDVAKGLEGQLLLAKGS